MRVTFVSNYINHHQIPFCDAMYERLGDDFCFVQTEPMEEERVRMGWGAELEKLPYLRLYYEQEKACRSLIADSEVVLFGGVEDESYIVDRLREEKLTLRISERIYREGQWKAVSPKGLRKKYIDHTRYRKKPVYLLCNGGYVASDFHIVRAYPDKMFKWGYFPESRQPGMEALRVKKREARQRTGKVSLLWAGRFLKLKHPDYAIRAAARLKKEGLAFSLTMVGGGELEADLKKMAEDWGLGEEILFTGFKKPEEVRRCMEEADIYLFTSDYREGWGAVLNEAMNSGCAVVANSAAGAVPFLIKPGSNGRIYPNGKWHMFYRQLKELVENPEEADRLGAAAYVTITEEWNAKTAAERLLHVLDGLLQGEVNFYGSGILSRAPVIAPIRMYRQMLKAGKTGEKENGTTDKRHRAGL